MSAAARQGGIGRAAVIGLPVLWLLLFFAIPFAIVIKVSLADSAIAQPPFTDVFVWGEGAGLFPSFAGDFENYAFLLEDPLYLNSYLNSILTAAVSTILCLIVAYPMAYFVARAPLEWRGTLLMLVVLPFWTSSLLRTYALMGFLTPTGYVNSFLQAIGVLAEGEFVQLTQTDFAVYLGIVFTYLPLMVLPLYSTLEKLDGTLLEASADLGATTFGTFWQVTLPLSLPGIASGCLLVFIPAVGEYVIPALLGGPNQLMIGRVLYTEFFSNRDWPVASAIAVAMLVLLVVPFIFLRNSSALRSEA